ncbi:diguanylate cyclase (GGDEF)-like protein [Breoghania corrubedonensis]|uniref:diguanylate cyclase n=1 Tax=Breoghania corrubedonensis TaxID=665038 RepID=A0A2T5UNY1_9HYPH|nr:GGDEF domain-containing protein [Breoghania corrubedonensis]PTW53207.1 diguanylate cyclase (GGDEF)-like protein [Breoghania corrubedonensis]
MVDKNILLLLAEALLYFAVMAGLLYGRRRFGIGLFVCAIGVMHFLETYLASVFYIQLPFGQLSPGSTVLFSGKLMMILMLYIKEDAVVARQPIYGLLIGNFLIVGLVMLLRNHEVAPIAPGRLPDMSFVDEMGWLMVWGTTLLFIDSIAIILLYERLGSWLKRLPFLRLFVSGAAVLSFDQAGFFTALHFYSGAPFAAMIGGWMAKVCAAFVFSFMIVAYLRFVERERPAAEHPTDGRQIADIFYTLTFRERYEDLLRQTGRDPLTGAFNRRKLELMAAEAFERDVTTAEPLSLLAIDIDRFKSVNDRFGHKVGDDVLNALSTTLARGLRSDDQLFRYGGEEFVVLSPNLGPAAAALLAERLREAVNSHSEKDFRGSTISIGVATAPMEATDFDALFACADARLYEAKNSGRNRVVSAYSELRAHPTTSIV